MVRRDARGAVAVSWLISLGALLQLIPRFLDAGQSGILESIEAVTVKILRFLELRHT